MVYSQARLDHALRVFREGIGYFNQNGLPSENLERHLRSNYAFRKVTKAAPSLNTSIWHSKDSDAGSDDDEYDPLKERRKLTTRKRKTEKRKAEDDDEEKEKPAKRNKGDTVSSPGADKDGFLTLKLVSGKGKQLLLDLSRIHRTDLASFDRGSPEEKEPSYWNRYRSSSRSAGRRVSVSEMSDDKWSDMDVSTDKTSSKHLTSLRSGKVLEKTTKPALDDERDPENINVTNVVTTEKPPAASAEGHGMALTAKDDGIDKQTASYSYYDQSDLFTIETSYANPIDFKFLPSNGTSCDFCADYRMGILGLGKRTITVFIDPDDATKLHETGNGHRSAWGRETRMCVSCALDRLMIMRCHSPEEQDNDQTYRKLEQKHKHNSRPSYTVVPGLKISKEGLAHYKNHLFDAAGTFGPQPKGPMVTCTLCPAPAVWKCCKWQKLDKTNRPCIVPEDHNNYYAERARMTAASSVRSLSSSSSTPASVASLSRSFTPTHGGGLPGHKRKASVIVISSDSDSDTHESKTRRTKVPLSSTSTPSKPHVLPTPSTTSTITTSKRIRTGSSEITSSHPPSQSQPHGSLQPFSTNTSSQSTEVTPTSTSQSTTSTYPSQLSLTPPSSSQTPLTPPSSHHPSRQLPLKGCGLHLCNDCRIFLSTECNDLLHKKKVMGYLRNTSKFKARADVDWVFGGSLMARSYRR